MTTLAVSAAIVGISCTAIIYGTDVFCALVLRPAAAGAAEESIADLVGRVHEYGDRRLPAPGAIAVVAAAVATVVSQAAVARTAAAVALVALLAWLAVYARVSVPINKRLRTAAATHTVPADTRTLQQRWDSVIWLRAGLQALALAGLLVTAITQ